MLVDKPQKTNGYKQRKHVDHNSHQHFEIDPHTFYQSRWQQIVE